jgi:hypothetical protein
MSVLRVSSGFAFVVALVVALASNQTPRVWNNAELEAAITAAMEQGTAVELPAKVILDKTVHIGLRQNLRFQGGGGTMMNWNQANNARCGGTRIFWRGPSTDPVFVTAGVGIEWDGIAFVLDNPTSACVHVIKGAGLGSGKHVIESCSFLENPANRQRSVGVLLGVTIGDINCDETTMRDCRSIDMRHMFMSANSQSVGNRFYNNLSNRNLAVFNFAAGGKSFIFGHSCVHDNTFLRLGQQGGNNAYISVEGLGVDSGAPDNWKLIDNPFRKSVRVPVSGQISGKAAKPRAELISGDNQFIDLANLAGVLTTNGQE